MQYEHLEFQGSHFQTLAILQDMQYLNENFLFFLFSSAALYFLSNPMLQLLMINDFIACAPYPQHTCARMHTQTHAHTIHPSPYLDA